MRKYTPLLCICLALVWLGTIASPALSADDDKPFIFINSASVLGWGAGENFGMVRFGEIARAHGFTIDHGVRPSFADGTALEGVAVMVFFDPNFTLTTGDIIGLRQWIRAGGILITGEWYDPPGMNGFLEEFGVQHQPRVPGDMNLMVPSGSPLSNPNTINTLFARGGRPIDVTNAARAEVILEFDDGSGAMTRTIANDGKGEIITVGCIRMLFDSEFTINGDIGFNDNDKLVQNLFTYLKSKFESTSDSGYDLNLLKVKFKKGTVFVPGDEIKFIARIRNIGTEQSEETRVVFYMERKGSTPSAKIEITSSTLSAINAKNKTKILKKTFLPDDLAPGTYEVTAVIDPDFLTADTNTNNNFATAKKTIIVQ